jgi:hypothetical protein
MKTEQQTCFVSSEHSCCCLTAHRQRATRYQTEALIGQNWTPPWELESEQQATITHNNSVLEESTSAAGAEIRIGLPWQFRKHLQCEFKANFDSGPWRMIMGPVIHMLNKRQVHDRDHKSWPFHFTLIKSNPVDISTSCSYNIYFDIILPSTSRYNREARNFHSVNRLHMTMNADCLTESPCKYCMRKKKNYETLRYVIFFITVFHLGTDQSLQAVL